MATTSVTLTSALRANLLSLQSTQSLLDQTQFRLATGKKVNSALDNASAFFTSQTLTNSANDLGNLLDGMGQAVQLLKATDNGLTAITTLVNQALSILQQAAANVGASNVTYGAQYLTIQQQIDALTTDTAYNGVKLLTGGAAQSVQFNTAGSSTLSISTVTDTTAGLLLTASTPGAGTNAVFGAGGVVVLATVNAEITKLNAALATLRTQATTFAQNLSVIQNRQEFSQNLVNTLKGGSDLLTVADKNEEGAKLLALQTTQQLGIQALSLASQANQSVLRLFG